MKEKLMTLTLTQLRELAKAAGIRGTGLKKEALVDALVKADQERKEKAEKSEKPEKQEKPENTERSEKREKAEKQEKSAKPRITKAATV